MTQVTTEKLYQHRPKAQGITIRRLQFNPQSHSPALFCQFTGHVAFADGIVFDFSHR